MNMAEGRAISTFRLMDLLRYQSPKIYSPEVQSFDEDVTIDARPPLAGGNNPSSDEKQGAR